MEQGILKDAASNVQALASKKYRQATTSVDAYVGHNPWKVVGVSAALGLLIGFLTARR
jgi:ElaB/YqjD/DUF883 family membrane-anchored ribosome-binding protein